MAVDLVFTFLCCAALIGLGVFLCRLPDADIDGFVDSGWND